MWGENFLDFDEQTRCNFGSKSVVAEFINSGYLRCRAPFSDVTAKAIPFSVSLNKQQNSKDKVDYWYYNAPTVAKLKPNYGPDQGGNEIEVHGSAFYPFDFDKDIDNRNDTFCHFQKLGKTHATVTNSTRAYCKVPQNILNLGLDYVEITLND